MSDLSKWCLTHYDALKDFVGPGVTLVAASAATWITHRFGTIQAAIARQQAVTAKQQADTALDRLRYDLFEMRITVFNAVRDLLLAVFEESNISDEALTAFVRGTEISVFLFDHTVTDYIAEMRNHAAQLKFAAARLRDKTLPNGTERDTFVQMEADLTNWFTQQFEVIIIKFKPALAFERDIATRLPRPVEANC